MRRSDFIKTLLVVAGVVLAAALPQSQGAAQSPAKSGIDRTVLPVPEPQAPIIYHP